MHGQEWSISCGCLLFSFHCALTLRHALLWMQGLRLLPSNSCTWLLQNATSLHFLRDFGQMKTTVTTVATCRWWGSVLWIVSSHITLGWSHLPIGLCFRRGPRQGCGSRWWQLPSVFHLALLFLYFNCGYFKEQALFICLRFLLLLSLHTSHLFLATPLFFTCSLPKAHMFLKLTLLRKGKPFLSCSYFRYLMFRCCLWLLLLLSLLECSLYFLFTLSIFLIYLLFC